jgi:hypothetical protein
MFFQQPTQNFAEGGYVKLVDPRGPTSESDIYAQVERMVAAGLDPTMAGQILYKLMEIQGALPKQKPGTKLPNDLSAGFNDYTPPEYLKGPDGYAEGGVVQGYRGNPLEYGQSGGEHLFFDNKVSPMAGAADAVGAPNLPLLKQSLASDSASKFNNFHNRVDQYMRLLGVGQTGNPSANASLGQNAAEYGKFINDMQARITSGKAHKISPFGMVAYGRLNQAAQSGMPLKHYQSMYDLSGRKILGNGITRKGYAEGGEVSNPYAELSMDELIQIVQETSPRVSDRPEDVEIFQMAIQELRNRQEQSGLQPTLDNDAMSLYNKGGVSGDYAKGGLSMTGSDAGGQDDTINARLSEGEYVVPADAVAALGDGNPKAGAKRLEKMTKGVRKHKSGTGHPPKAKDPEKYMGGK